MNVEIKGNRFGMSLIYAGIGVYLVVLELVRLINYFVAEFTSLTSVIYFLTCFVCCVLIVVGIAISMMMVWRNSVGPLILGVVSFPLVGIVLFYSAYLIPYTQNRHFEATDWMLFSIISLGGVLFVVRGMNFWLKK